MKSFFEILQDTISDEHSTNETEAIQNHPEYQTQFQDPAYLSYLMGKINKFEARLSQKQTPYIRYKKEIPPQPPPPPKIHSLNELQKKAWDFFKKQSWPLSLGFTEKELRKAYKGLAFKLHPDTNKNSSSVLFCELKKSYDLLTQVLVTQS